MRALGGTRTPNLLIRSQMLYPLSYECLVVLGTPCAVIKNCSTVPELPSTDYPLPSGWSLAAACAGQRTRQTAVTTTPERRSVYDHHRT